MSSSLELPKQAEVGSAVLAKVPTDGAEPGVQLSLTHLALLRPSSPGYFLRWLEPWPCRRLRQLEPVRQFDPVRGPQFDTTVLLGGALIRPTFP